MGCQAAEELVLRALRHLHQVALGPLALGGEGDQLPAAAGGVAGAPHVAAALDGVQVADEMAAADPEPVGLELELVTVPVHPYRPGLLDAWATLSVIAAATRRIRILPDVANLPLRPPAAPARTSAGFDPLSGGRGVLGVGAGAYWDSITAEGVPHRSPGEAVAATREAIEILLRALRAGGGRVRFEGKHYHLAGAAAGPAPAHPISVWTGTVGPRMRRLTGAADHGRLPSVPHVPPPRLARGRLVIDEAAEGPGGSRSRSAADAPSPRAPAASRRMRRGTGPSSWRSSPSRWARAPICCPRGIRS
ncbi:LLM class flavin-dependent oxidoreductase [Streptomyces sp. NPDC085944]|uniref:LLM class flavin-dependent oxidoreductase n=1 Tax=Streptomyces sp. NPDC085944 TaxID=3154962 RepID=UPI0034431638